jgi:hypothetical protein
MIGLDAHSASPRSRSTSRSPVKQGIPGLRWQHACRSLNYAVGTGRGVGKIVAEAVRVVRESGVPNRTDAMFTNIVCLTHC